MIAYIIKTVLCSGLLILIYHLLLEREKIYKFNRGYLLFSIAFSFIIPLISIKVRSSVGLISESFYQTSSIVKNTVPQQTLPYVTEGITLTQLLLFVYVAITAFLFIRFFINVFSLFNKIKHSSSVPYLDAKFVLTKDKLVPYSFLKYVFIHNEDFAAGKIEGEILSHELTHVKQKHSFDILFIELLLIFAWINPLLFLYRKAIQLNHEFLADEFVVKKFNDTKTYQLLLIDKALQPNRLMLSSQFNYLLTKKRIIMMSKKASFKIAILKQIALIPVIAVAGFLFTTKVIAQEKVTTLNQPQIESTQSGVSQELLKEYQDILDKYKKTLDNGKESYLLKLSQSDKERLEKIFLQMSKEQQANQMLIFYPANSLILTRTVPSTEQLESFKDPKIYGVWIDRKRVNNDVFNNYKNTDFAYVMISQLAKNATNYGKHVYQVDLMTNDYYQRYYDETIARKGYICRPNFKRNVANNILIIY
jgi:bla regulator protein blaR1